MHAGLIRAFRRSPVAFLAALTASGARAAPVRMGTEHVLLLDDPSQVWELLTTHARRTQKGRGLARAKVLLGEGLLTSEGETHLRHPGAADAVPRAGGDGYEGALPPAAGGPGRLVGRRASTSSRRCRP